MKNRVSVKILYLAIPAIVISLIWSPVFQHFYVATPELSQETIERARQNPPDTLFDALSEFRFLVDSGFSSDNEIVARARQYLQGTFKVPGFKAVSLSPLFDKTDIETGQLGVQLYRASLYFPDVLLDAYEITGEEEFLEAARERIIGWAKLEQSLWLPVGLIWNAHAIAARMTVVAKFWRYYRSRDDFDIDMARLVLQMAARQANLLARRDHYHYANNYGVMQNLAIWHYSLSFPNLPNAQRFRNLAKERLLKQMEYYVNSEGVILEHSLGYHRDGLILMGYTLRYLSLLKEQIPLELLDKYNKAVMFYHQMLRPDGSKPLIGDTETLLEISGPPLAAVDSLGNCTGFYYDSSWQPSTEFGLYPVAGYAVAWSGLNNWPDMRELSETVISWSHFAGHAHPAADELTVNLRAGGHDWWTGVGYAPAGSPYRTEALGWRGSNAPHRVGESWDSERESTLLGYANDSSFLFLDIERRGDSGFTARRQLLYIKPDRWLLLDNTNGLLGQQTATVWTTSSEIEITEGSTTSSFLLTAPDGSSLTVHMMNAKNAQTSVLRSSFTPFGGWNIVSFRLQPAASIEIRQPAKSSVTAYFWDFQSETSMESGKKTSAALTYWNEPNDWEVQIAAGSIGTTIRRSGWHVQIESDNPARPAMAVQITEPPADVGIERQRIEFAFKSTAKEYPSVNVATSGQTKVTYALLLLIVLQELFFWGYRHWLRKGYSGLRIASIAAWLIGGAWLVLIYF